MHGLISFGIGISALLTCVPPLRQEAVAAQIRLQQEAEARRKAEEDARRAAEQAAAAQLMSQTKRV